MEETKYEIGGVEYYHRELTWGQDKKIMALIAAVSGNIDGKETIGFTAGRLKNLVLKYDVLGDFWGLILIPRKSYQYWATQGAKLLRPWKWRGGYRRWIDLSTVPNTMLEDMFEDFFLLNKKLLKRLSTLNDVLGLIAQTAMKMEKEKTTSTGPSTTSTLKKPPYSGTRSAES